MKLRRLLERLEVLLNAEERARSRESDELKKILKALKKKERKLQREAEEAGDPQEAQALEARLKVVRAQRSKGVAARKALRKA
jgi:DNA primase large subunit